MTTLDPRELPNDVEALKQLFIAEIVKRDEKIRELEHSLRVLTKIHFAPKSERRPSASSVSGPGQLPLLFEELVQAAERAADESRSRARSRSAPAAGPRRPSAASAFRRTCR
jgi:hypothetical protein